ncbi:MAG: V-type ATP synthase subunit I, partial [Victivallaceae bacterium]
MIVPMRKIVLVMPVADRSSAVSALRELGVVHVAAVELPENARRLHLATELAEIDRLVTLLENLPGKAEKVEISTKTHTGEALFRLIRDTVADNVKNDRRIDQLQQIRSELAVWGDFDGTAFESLRARGVQVYLCVAAVNEFARQQELGRVCHELSRDGKTVRFAIVSTEKLAPETMPLAKLPDEISLSAVNAELDCCRQRQRELEAKLRQLRSELPHLLAHKQELEEALEYLTVRDSLEAKFEQLLSIGGFVPEEELPKIAELARTQGWGLIDREADPAREAVPTLLKTPRWAHLIDPLMKFLAITPGYAERDVSIPVLFFFTIFFGMLVGDAGYGLIFLIGATAAYAKLHKKRPELKTVLGLLILLNLSAVVWGALTGNYFGMQRPGLPWLASDKDKDLNVQLVCFSLALIQLSLGRCIQAFSGSSWKSLVGHLGWMLILIGNFILVYRLLLWPGDFPVWMYICYGAGILAAAAGDIDWSDVGSIFGFPFSVVGSFVDILSYIRLFAVGMAGFYLAQCFNQMALPLMDNPLGLVAGLIVLCFGHLLNIALAAMAVLVHGVRLNTLEFSNHVGLRWAGFTFRPFAKRKEIQQAVKN